MEQYQVDFIELIANYVIKYAKQYNVLVHSPIIAQAILESGWGKSTLATQYNNYFGMKVSSNWNGKCVNLQTQEEYTVGTHTVVSADFRVYNSVEDCVKGYFDFLFVNKSRYDNLKGITDYKQYIQLIKEDGYATSSTYVEKLIELVELYNLTKYDEVIDMNEQIKEVTQTIYESIDDLAKNVANIEVALEKLKSLFGDEFTEKVEHNKK